MIKIFPRALNLLSLQAFVYRRTDGQTDAKLIALSPEPCWSGVKRIIRTILPNKDQTLILYLKCGGMLFYIFYIVMSLIFFLQINKNVYDISVDSDREMETRIDKRV